MFDYLLPDARAGLVALFEGDALDTSVLLVRAGSTLSGVYGPEVIRQAAGPLGGEFRRDYRVIRRAIETQFAPLAFGLFTETATLQRLLVDTRPGAWGEAIAARDVVLDPMPGWVAVAAGAGVVRAAAARSKAIVDGLGLLGAMSPAVRRVREVAESLAGFDPERVLGFNPLRLLGETLRGDTELDPQRKSRT